MILRSPPSSIDDALVGRVFQDRFEVLSPIGSGAMGAVYKAWQRSVDRPVALKLLHPEIAGDRSIVKRFMLEARATSRLTNPHTVTIYDFGETDDDILFIVMEYLDGCPLRDHLEQRRRLPAAEAVPIMAQVADSLAEAHAKGIVHRDLKPENVLLVEGSTGAPMAKVLDFGIARATEISGGEKLTRTGAIAGTPTYMSPEGCEGRQVDARADVYAIGVMLYEMLTGRPPFVSESPMRLLMAHVQKDIPSIHVICPDVFVPGSLLDLIYRCLEKDPDDRPADAAEVRNELAGVYAEMLAGAEPDLAPLSALGIELGGVVISTGTGLANVSRQRVRRWRRIGLYAGAAGALVAIAAALLVVLGSDRPGADPASGQDPSARAGPPADQAQKGPEPTPSPKRPEAAEAGEAVGGSDEAGSVSPAPDPAVAGVPEAPATPATAKSEAAGGDSVEAAEADEKPGTVTITLKTKPASATVVRGSEKLGSTPLELRLPRGSEPVLLRLVALNYQINEIEVVPDADRAYDLLLKRKAHRTSNVDLLP